MIRNSRVDNIELFHIDEVGKLNYLPIIESTLILPGPTSKMAA